MTDLISKQDLQTLLEDQQGASVSIYMPSNRKPGGMKEDMIRFENLLDSAAKRLRELGVEKPESMLRQASGLLADGNREFWNTLSDGLAVFVSPGYFKIVRAPFVFRELVAAGNHFHVKPLLPLFGGFERFFILALGQHRSGFYQCTPRTIDEVELPGQSKTYEEALRPDASVLHEYQFSTHVPARDDKRSSLLYRQGEGAENDVRERFLRYFQEMEAEISGLLPQERPLVILAGFEPLTGFFREANLRFHIPEDWLPGDPFEIPAERLHAQALEVARPHLDRELEQTLTAYHQGKGTGAATDNLGEIIPAAAQGRVHALFVAVDANRWGSFNPETLETVVFDDRQAGDTDLLDFAAAQTAGKGGQVFALPPERMPDGAVAAAIFRYGPASDPLHTSPGDRKGLTRGPRSPERGERPGTGLPR